MRIPLTWRSGPERASEVLAALGPGGGPVATRDVNRLPIVSPWSPTHTNLFQWVADDVLGEAAAAAITTRASAMRLPGIARARNLIVTAVMRNPLVAYRGPVLHAITSEDEARVQRLDPQPGWTTATTDGSSPELRNGWTADDHLFYGWSLWRHRLGVDNFPLASDHVAFDEWYVDDDNRLCVHGSPVTNEREWTLIPGAHEGILTFGADVLRDGRDILALVRDRLENPVPDINLEAQPDSEDMTGDEWRDFVTAYVANRKVNKGVGFTNRFVKAVPMPGRKDSDLMVEARNASVVDQARIVGVHAGMLDATAPKASLNYETQTGRNQEFVDLDLYTYLLPIAARLSMPDVTPRGQRVAFDLSDFTGPAATPTPTTPEATP